MLQATPLGDSEWPLGPTVCVQRPLCQHQRLCEPIARRPGNGDAAKKNFSVSQRRTQWTSGWKVAGALLQALWGGLRLPDNAAACVHVMYGYDCSVAEAVLRMTSSPPTFHGKLCRLGRH